MSIGSAPLAPATLKKLQDKMAQASVINSYGLTEAGPAYITMPKEEADKRIGSVGQPNPPMEVKVVDPDTDALRPPHEVGELLVRLPGKRREYYKDDGANAARGPTTAGCAPATSRISTKTASSTSRAASRT